MRLRHGQRGEHHPRLLPPGQLPDGDQVPGAIKPELPQHLRGGNRPENSRAEQSRSAQNKCFATFSSQGALSSPGAESCLQTARHAKHGTCCCEKYEREVDSFVFAFPCILLLPHVIQPTPRSQNKKEHTASQHAKAGEGARKHPKAARTHTGVSIHKTNPVTARHAYFLW